MAAREFVEHIIWNLEPDVGGLVTENEALTAARAYGVLDGCAFVVWRLPAKSAWCVWRDGETVDVNSVIYSDIARPEDVANAVRAWVYRLSYEREVAHAG